jgi:hypothetical protein
MLYCEPLDTEELSQFDSGGVSIPELELQVLERERLIGEA